MRAGLAVGLPLLAVALGLGLALAPGRAAAQASVEGEPNRGKAALQLKRYDQAAARFFDRFSWPDQKSQDVYTSRVAAYIRAINSCQAEANTQGSPVTCLVPGVDWNPKTWETC